mgnify:CR=1 FL=1
MRNIALRDLLSEIKQCRLCEKDLPLGARPVLQVNEQARILIAGQAPGIKVHESGIPFNDASGNRLRQWMGISSDVFYNSEIVAILPMGFCYPGKGKSGDLPPRPECALTWRNSVLQTMPNIELLLVIGTYAQQWHMKGLIEKNLTETVKQWQRFWPDQLPLPHPSPRNNIWLKRNAWFENEVIPELQSRVMKILSSHNVSPL